MIYTVEEYHPGVLVVSIAGRITVENGDGAFVDAIDTALAANPRQVIIDFADVSTIDSCGLGELVASYLRARRAGCRLCVVHPNARVLEILRVTRLDAVLVEPPHFVINTAAIA